MKKKTAADEEKNPFLKELNEILGKRRPIEQFADDDYYIALPEDLKRTRQALSHLYLETPKDNPASKVIFGKIKEILESCDPNSLLVWYRSELSGSEVCKLTKQIAKEKFNADLDSMERRPSL